MAINLVPNRDTLLAMVGAMGGGGLIKLIERYFRFREKREDLAVSLRNELHERVRELVAELDSKQGELDSWRDKYYQLRERIAFGNEPPK